MAETTKIGWADSTPNFWIGCTKVGPGCENCYAIPIAANMGIGWGDDAPRRRVESWKAAVRFNAMRDRGKTTMMRGGVAVPVPLWQFGNSLSDIFDNHPDLPPLREHAWGIIRETPLMRWILLTKRVSNVRRMLPANWNGRDYQHVGIVASVCNQEEYDRDLSRLIALKALSVRWVGLSIEPQLGPISIADTEAARRLDWAIGGGESEQLRPARRYEIEWGERLIEQCSALGIPYFQKQVGSLAFHRGVRFRTKDRAGADETEWPAHLRVQEMPRVYDHEERRASQPTML
jgi:protein gp37